MKSWFLVRHAAIRKVLSALLLTFLLTLHSRADMPADNVNGSATLENATYPSSVVDIAFLYTAKANFNLTGLQTKFHSVDNRSVTVEVGLVDKNGMGTFVRAGNLTPSTTFSSVFFTPLFVEAGAHLLIGFRNVAGLGQNTTADGGAKGLPALFDSVGDGRYDMPFANPQFPILILLQPDGPVPLYAKGDLLPDHGTLGIPNDAAFTTFGVPAVGHLVTIAMRATYASPTNKGADGKGTGIFVNGRAVALQFGPAASGAPTGASYKTLADPVVDDAGHVAFLATISGHGISGTVMVSDAPGGTLTVVAESGHPAAESPTGIVWTKFTSMALPGGNRGPVFIATLAGPKLHGNQAVFGVDHNGQVRRLLGDGDSIPIGGNTNKIVKSFALLKALTGLMGAGRSYNDVGDVVSLVTFTDGSQSVVRTKLP